LARQLLGSGAQVALVGLNHPALEALRALAPERCRIYTPDVSSAQAMQAMAADFLKHWGAPDLVVANAGVAGGFETSDPADLAVMRRMLEINLLGVATTFQPFLQAMLDSQRPGALVGVASVGAQRGAALIGIDGQAPKPYQIGREVVDGLILQSVDRLGARLGAQVGGPSALQLDMPLPRQP
jgi:NAD(P)-dependent dehydrogenase (short-subunit alcohol dehydrogenase family)